MRSELPRELKERLRTTGDSLVSGSAEIFRSYLTKAAVTCVCLELRAEREGGRLTQVTVRATRTLRVEGSGKGLSGNTLLILAIVLMYTLAGVHFGFNQPDPRLRHHSVNIVPFVENGLRKYYLSWASLYADDWEPEIYASAVHFGAHGERVADRLA